MDADEKHCKEYIVINAQWVGAQKSQSQGVEIQNSRIGSQEKRWQADRPADSYEK